MSALIIFFSWPKLSLLPSELLSPPKWSDGSVFTAQVNPCNEADKKQPWTALITMLTSLRTHEEHNYLYRRCIALLVIALTVRGDSWAASSLYKACTFCSSMQNDKLFSKSRNSWQSTSVSNLSYGSELVWTVGFTNYISVLPWFLATRRR